MKTHWDKRYDQKQTTLGVLAMCLVVMSLGLLAIAQPAVSIAAGPNYSLALLADGTVMSWGSNSSGELGDGTTAARLTPVPVVGLRDVTSIASALGHEGMVPSLAVDQHGMVWAWGGLAFAYSPPPSSLTYISVPTAALNVGTLSCRVREISERFLVATDGTVWSWGWLGVSVSIPSQVQGVSHIVSLASQRPTWDSTLAVRADGTVWLIDLRSSPAAVQVGGIANVISVTQGLGHNLALCADGSVWAWGENSFGQLGDGTTQNSQIPHQIPNLNYVVSISAGVDFSLALCADGTIWAWGANQEGQLGDGSMINRHTPIQISSLSNIRTITAGNWHALAVRDDGEIWAWGKNSAGQLGDGTTMRRTAPVKVR